MTDSREAKICLWLALVLIAWSQLFDSDVGRSHKTARILNYVSRFLASMLIGVQGGLLWQLMPRKHLEA